MDLPLSVLSQVTTTLQQQNIPYVLVGSFASSIHGMYRSTADIDILADIHTEQIRPLFEADDFGEEFTPELREQEERIRAKAEQLQKKKE